jgi:hypothetical protein
MFQVSASTQCRRLGLENQQALDWRELKPKTSETKIPKNLAKFGIK